MYYLSLTLTILYSVLYSLFYDFGYLSSAVPVGQIRVNPLAPTNWTKPEDLKYCLLPTDKPGDKYKGFPKYPCMYWDEEIAVWPQALDGVITLTTRVSQTYETLNCSLTEPNCTWDLSPTNVSFPADPEDFTLLLDHSFSAPSVGHSDNAINLKGTLLDENDTEVKVKSPEQFGIKGEQDILKVSTILRAAGIDLDGPSLYNPNNSARYDGCIVIAHVSYTNTYGHILRMSTQYYES